MKKDIIEWSLHETIRIAHAAMAARNGDPARNAIRGNEHARALDLVRGILSEAESAVYSLEEGIAGARSSAATAIDLIRALPTKHRRRLAGRTSRMLSALRTVRRTAKSLQASKQAR